MKSFRGFIYIWYNNSKNSRWQFVKCLKFECYYNSILLLYICTVDKNFQLFEDEIEYYFAEDQGRYIIEVNKDGLKKVTDILNKNAVHFDELGTINEDQLFINEKTKVSIDELRTSNTSWLTNYMSK